MNQITVTKTVKLKRCSITKSATFEMPFDDPMEARTEQKRLEDAIKAGFKALKLDDPK